MEHNSSNFTISRLLPNPGCSTNSPFKTVTPSSTTLLTSSAVNDAVLTTLQWNGASYDSVVHIERDGEGNPVFDGFSAERFGTGKGMEYKAWDKLKACELLLRLAERENQGGSEFGEVLQALQEGARQLDDWKEADEP